MINDLPSCKELIENIMEDAAKRIDALAALR